MVKCAIYARSSPDCPATVRDQIDHLMAVAGERGWAVMNVFQDKPTPAKKPDRRPGEKAMIAAIRGCAVDRVLVWSIDRIGRSLVELIEVLNACRALGVEVYFHAQDLDTATANGMSLFDLAGMMALHLRQSRRDRILRGQAAARSMSIRFGRPSVPATKAEKAKRALASGKGIRETARLVGISPASVFRIKAATNPQVVTV